MRHSSIEIEHRLTRAEVTLDSSMAQHRSHRKRLDELERKQITPRDWLMIAGGVFAMLGALLGKVDWATALNALAPK